MSRGRSFLLESRERPCKSQSLAPSVALPAEAKMSEFIFYTVEGLTEAPSGKEVENAQLLGTAKGATAKCAWPNF